MWCLLGKKKIILKKLKEKYIEVCKVESFEGENFEEAYNYLERKSFLKTEGKVVKVNISDREVVPLYRFGAYKLYVEELAKRDKFSSFKSKRFDFFAEEESRTLGYIQGYTLDRG